MDAYIISITQNNIKYYIALAIGPFVDIGYVSTWEPKRLRAVLQVALALRCGPSAAAQDRPWSNEVSIDVHQNSNPVAINRAIGNTHDISTNTNDINNRMNYSYCWC